MAFKKVRAKKKFCIFCTNKNTEVDYKDVETLKKFVSPNGKISPRRSTGACALHQRSIAVAIKNARYMALLPYIAD